MQPFVPTDYGYTCHYERPVKKRGRAPGARTAKSAPILEPGSQNQEVVCSPTGAVPASGSFAPPDAHEDRNETHSGPQTGFDSREKSSQHQSHSQPRQHYPNLHGEAARRSSFHRGSLNLIDVLNEDTQYTSPAQYTSPTQFNDAHLVTQLHYPATSVTNVAREHDSASSPDSPWDQYQRPSLQNEPGCHSRYQCLDPLLPYLRGIIPTSVAYNIFDVYLVDPGTSLFRCASPYILTRIFRKKSLFHPTNARSISPALLAAILWCCVQTADTPSLHIPGARSKVAGALYRLASSLISERTEQEPGKRERRNCRIASPQCDWANRNSRNIGRRWPTNRGAELLQLSPSCHDGK